jgi:protein-tyrosine phosphatase
MDPPAAAELRRLGADAAAFRARAFTTALASRADLILTATTDHRRLVLEAAPGALRKTFTLLEFASLVSSVDPVREASGNPSELVRRAALHRGDARLQDYDVADPYGRAVEAHRQMADVVSSATRSIATALV